MDKVLKYVNEKTKNGDKKVSKEMIDKLRTKVQNKLRILDENREWRGEVNEDIRFENFMDEQMLTWMEDDPERFYDEENVYLYISSLNRDKTTWPQPSEYLFELSSELDNIVKAQLVQASFPLVDTTVNDSNHVLRYSVSPFTTIKELTIPNGNYKGAALAVEITRQMNMDYFSVQLLAGTYVIEESTGLVLDSGTGTYPAATNQFRCQWVEAWDKFIFQAVDPDLLSTNSLVFAVHVKIPDQNAALYRNQSDDIFRLLGFQYSAVAQQGTLDGSGETYRLVNTTAYADLGKALDVDSRISYSVYGNMAADLRGGLALVLDIDKLNDNDIVQPELSTIQTGFSVASCFGFLLFSDPSNINDRMLNLSNGSYPIAKYYREGVSRLNQMMVRIRRIDGTLVDFKDKEHMFTIKITVKRTQPKKSVFTR